MQINIVLKTLVYYICGITIASVIIILSVMEMGEKAMKKLLVTITLIITILVFYFFNYNISIFIKSNLASQHTHTAFYENDRRINIPLPKKSVWLFKTPTDFYYSKYDVKKCMEFFESTLYQMKQNNEIKNYFYDINKKTFTVEIEGSATNIIISLIGDSDTRRYGISDPNY